MQFDENCEGCKISQKKKVLQGGIITLDGGWILNHYGDDQAFLGWMVLQPFEHKMEFQCLADPEVRALGPNIKRIDSFLREYWECKFPDDAIQRLYVAHFFEGPFDSPPPKAKYHLHIHLITRPASFDRLLREDVGKKPNGKKTGLNAWKIYRILRDHPVDFPKEYRKTRKNVEALMNYLRGKLGS